MIDAQGYIFDLDGTLALSQQFHYQAYSIVLAEEGITYTREEDIALYAGQGSEKIFPHIFRKHDRPITTEKTHQLVQRKREVYQELIENDPIDPVPGVKEYLDQLTEQEKKIIVATGNRRDPSEVILKRTGLDSYFRDIVTIEDVSEPKPSPETFLLALSRLQLDAKECIIFEDAANGVEAAKASGVYCVGVSTNTSAERLQQAGADYVITDYREFLSTK